MRFFSPPEKPSLTGRLSRSLLDVQDLHLLLDQREEVDGVEFLQAAVLADGVEGRSQEVGVADAGDLDRILEGQEDALARPLFGVHVEQVLALEEHLALGDLVSVAAGEHAGQRALAGAVRPHDGMDLAGVDLEVDAAQDFLVVDAACRFLISSIGDSLQRYSDRTSCSTKPRSLSLRLLERANVLDHLVECVTWVGASSRLLNSSGSKRATRRSAGTCSAATAGA